MPLTPKQKKVLEFVKKYSARHEFAPSLEEIRKHFKLRSNATVHQHIAALESKGYLRKRKNKHRSIVTQTNDRMIQIPLRGVIAAGQLHEAIENRETIAMPQSKLPFAKGDYYGLRVSGDSMVGENINDGDIILFRKQKTDKKTPHIVSLIHAEDYKQRISRLKKKQEKIQLIMPIQFSRIKCSFCNQKQDVDGRCPCVNKDAW